jgi:hypothetical protein
MAWLFASGHVVDLILGVMALETLVLLAWRRRTGGGVPARGLLAFLLSGACLMLALRVALTDGWWGWIGLWLAGAGAAHVLDLRTRWTR